MKNVLTAVCTLMLVTACNNSTSQGSSAVSAAHPAAEAKIKFVGKTDAGLTVAQINKKLKDEGVPERFPAEIVIDLTQTQAQILKQSQVLADIVDEVNEGDILDGQLVYSGACFIGSNKLVADNFDKLVDIWVSDQFQIAAVATSKPDHLGIKYTETDDGDVFAWLNMERCR